MSLNRKMRRQAQRASEKNANVFKRSRFNEQPENGQEDESFIKNMLGSISKSPFMKKVLLNAIGLTLMAAPAGYAESEIVPIGHTNVNKTAVLDSNNFTTGHYNYDITTGKRQYVNSIDLNAFKKFNLDNGDVANFFKTINDNNTIQKDAPIINFVQDKININGVVNCIESLSHDKREIGGRLFFISSNGILIGSTGVINTGCFYAIVPNEEFVNKFVNFADEVHPFETSGFLEYLNEGQYNEGVYFKESDPNETNAQKQARLDNLITRNISSITLSDTGIIEVNGTINAKRNVELLAGKTYKAGETDIDKSASIIIGPNAHINTYSYDTRQDFVMSALNLNESDTQAINAAMELYENDYSFENNEDNGKNPFGIRIKAIGQDGTAPTADGYATAIKSEGTLTSQKNVEFITEMATENATAKNAIQVSGTINANGTATGRQAADVRGLYIQGDGDVILGTSGHNLTVTENTRLVEINAGKDIKETANTTNALKANNEDQFGSNPIILSAGNNIELANTTMTTKKGVHLTSGGSTKAGDLTGDKIDVQAATGIELNNVTANGYTTENAGWTSNKYSWDGEVKLTNTDSGKIKVTGTILSNGYAKNAQGENVTDGQGKFVQETGIGEVNIENVNKLEDRNNTGFARQATQTGKNVEVNEVEGNTVGIYGYDVTAKKVNAKTAFQVVAGGKLTLGAEGYTEAFNSESTLSAEARSIEAKGNITAKTISLTSYEGATLKDVTSTNGDVGIRNGSYILIDKEQTYNEEGQYYYNKSRYYAPTGAVAVGNIVANKEEEKGNVTINNTADQYSNYENVGENKQINLNGGIDAKKVTISAGDDVTIGGGIFADNGRIDVSGKNITLSAGKDLDAGSSIELHASGNVDAKGSRIEAGEAIKIESTGDVHVNNTKSGNDSEFNFRGDFVSEGTIHAGGDLRIGSSWTVYNNNTSTSYLPNSVLLKGKTESGYTENNQNAPLGSYNAGNVEGNTYITAKTIESQGMIKAKGGVYVGSLNGDFVDENTQKVTLNEVDSLGADLTSYTYSGDKVIIKGKEVTANTITAVGNIDIEAENKATVSEVVDSSAGHIEVSVKNRFGEYSSYEYNNAEGEANINNASAKGIISIVAGKVNLDNAGAQAIFVESNQGANLSNLTTADNDATEMISSRYGSSHTSGITAVNTKTYSGKNEDGSLIPVEPKGDITFIGKINSNFGGVSATNDGGDIILGKDGAATNITGTSMSLYTQGNISDTTGNHTLTATSDGGSLSFRAIGGVTLANTAITSGGRFEVNNWFDNNAKVTISKDITAKTVHIEANKGIEVGNITANGGNIELDNTSDGIDYNTKIRRPDDWWYADGIDEEGKFDWGSTKATGHIVVNGNLIANEDASSSNNTGEIKISNYNSSSYSSDGEATVSERNVTMKNATGKTIEINTAGTLTAGDLTSTWEEQSPTIMDSRIKYKLDENGQRVRDEYGNYVIETDENGKYVYEDVEVENWDRTGIKVNASQITLNNVKSNNMTNVYSEKKVKLGDVEAAGVTITANEGITVGNVTTKADDGNVIISNKRLAHQEWRWVEDEDEGGNEGRENIKVNLRAGGKSELVKNTYTPASGLVSVGSVESKGKVEISNTSRVFKKKSSDEDSSSSYDSDSEYAEEATVDPSFNGASNEGVVIGGDVTGKTIKVISDGGIEVNGNMTATGYKYDPATDPSTKYDPNRDPLLNEGYSIVLDNDQLDELAKAFIKLGKKPNLENLRADIAENNKYSITAENGGVRIVNRAEGGEVVLQNVKGEIIYAKSMGDLTLDNAEVTQTKPNTMEETQVRPMTLISAGTLTVNESLKAEGGVSLTATCYTSFKNGKKYKLYGYNATPVEEEGAEIYVLNESSVDLAPNGVVDIEALLKDGKIRKYGSPEPEKPVTPDNPNKPETPEEVKQAFEDVGVEEGKATEEIDRTVNGNQENTDNSSNQEVSQVNDVSSLSDMGSDNIGGFEEMGSDAGGVDVGLSEGSAEFSMGADGSFEVASVGGAEDTGSGTDAGTASDGGMAPNDGAMAEDNTASNDGTMAEDNTASNDGAMAEDNTASNDGAVANDNTDSDTGNGEGSNSESSAEEGNDEKGEETASVDSSEEENEDNDKSGRPGKGKPGKEKNGGNKKLTQLRSMLHQAKDSATQQRR